MYSHRVPGDLELDPGAVLLGAFDLEGEESTSLQDANVPMTTESGSAIHSPMDHLGTPSAFVQAAETGSFIAAGRQLGLSASAIGKAVARLEKRLGVRLFHRNTRSMTMTVEGRTFLDRCRRIFEEIEAAELELSQTAVTPKGRLRVSMPLVGMLLMPVVADFMAAHPAIQLDLDFSNRLVREEACRDIGERARQDRVTVASRKVGLSGA